MRQTHSSLKSPAAAAAAVVAGRRKEGRKAATAAAVGLKAAAAPLPPSDFLSDDIARAPERGRESESLALAAALASALQKEGCFLCHITRYCFSSPSSSSSSSRSPLSIFGHGTEKEEWGGLG